VNTRYDALIIGSGQAGPFLAARLVAARMKVALIEREHLGGTCVNDGCMPTKALVASARVAHPARRASDFGVRLGGPASVGMAAIKARKDAIVNQAVANLTRWLGGLEGLRAVRGHARFVAAHAIEANGEILEAPKVFINVGGPPALPDRPGLADVPVPTDPTMMDLDVLPEHLIAIGGSYIGLEFAQIYRRFGARVTVVEAAERLIAREDEEVSLEVQAMLQREGVQFLLGVRDARVAPASSGSGVCLQLQAAGSTHVLQGSHLLAAVGRRPNTDQLGLGRNGMTEAQVRATGRPARVGVMPMSRVGRAMERGETQGFMKVLADAQSERVPGAALLCIEGDEIVHSLLDVMAADVSYQVVRRCVHIHPTVSELIATLLGQLQPLGGAAA
jgi:pyruvate/2-oxoglutarate dehydrogenase complex dihydrolipoamide dehydrogenase (E3) component